MADDRPLEDLVRWEVEDGVGWLTIDRPEARNALTHPMRDRVTQLLREASGDLAVRVVVVRGTGDAFCTGADLRSQPAGPARPAGAPDRTVGEVARLVRDGWGRLFEAVWTCEKPVICAVNGIAAGGGMHLALAGDIVLAHGAARFVEAFIRRGIAPDAGGAYLLTRLVGPQRAKELMFLGDALDAEGALAMGLVNRVHGDDFEDEVREWATRLAAAPTVAIAATKRLVNHALDVDLRTALDEEARAQEGVMGSHDAAEGIASFVERRDPDYRGW